MFDLTGICRHWQVWGAELSVVLKSVSWTHQAAAGVCLLFYQSYQMEKHCYVLSRCSWGYVPVLPQISGDALSNTSCWFIYCLYVVYLPRGFHAKLDMINRRTERVMFCHKSFIIRPSPSYLVFVFILESLDLWPRNAFVCQYKMSLTFVKVSVSSLSFHFSDNYTSLKVRAYARKFTLTFHLIFHLSQANKEHLLFLYQEVFPLILPSSTSSCIGIHSMTRTCSLPLW